MWWANNHFPAGLCSSDLICTSHFRIADSTNDEHNKTWHIFHCCLCFIFVPVAVACAIIQIELINELNICFECEYTVLYLVGAWYVELWALPAKNGKCRLSNLSSIQSSTMSLSTGVQRDIWYVCSVTRFFRGTWYGFLRCPCKVGQLLRIIFPCEFKYVYTWAKSDFLSFS